MAHHIGHILLVGLGARRGVYQQQAFAIRNTADVLHCSGGEIGQCHHVNLGVGVGDSVIVDKPTQALDADIHSEVSQMSLAWSVNYSQWNSVNINRCRCFEFADYKCHEIGAHGHGVSELNGDFVTTFTGKNRTGDLGSVANR